MAKTKVAIVGFSESSRHLAPFNDPEFEIWGCNHVYRYIPRGDVWFEFHDHETLAVKYGENWPEYSGWLKTQAMPLYMQEQHSEFPSSLRYPIEEITEKFAFIESSPIEGKKEREEKPRCTVQSTISYMLALAIHEGFKEIHLYGVDMVIDSEWGFQRQNIHYFMGWASGHGIKIVVPTECALLKEGTIDLYGYQNQTKKYVKLMRKMKEQDEFYKTRFDSLQEFNNGLVAKIQSIHGAMEELRDLLKNPSLNGQRDELEKRLRVYAGDFKKYNDKNDDVINQMQHTDGARQDNFRWLERLGYNDRGEQML